MEVTTINRFDRQPLTDLMELAEELVNAYFTDLRRSLFGSGCFVLVESHKQFVVSSSVWELKTQSERDHHYKRLRVHFIRHPRVVTSTDGESVVVASKTKGMKLNQWKRKRTELRVTMKKVKLVKKVMLISCATPFCIVPQCW